MPSAQLLSIAAQFGAAGLIALGAGWLIWQLTRSYEKRIEKIESRNAIERKDLTDTLARQHREALDQASKSSDALNSNTVMITKLCTIIDERRHL